ncbi:hypothetical protein Axi01nite_50040 [Actinoplanes xinjiangensis]|nr:hypothetical protein Axi01nite_50040 [Actinoplanes xinjiangensis]
MSPPGDNRFPPPAEPVHGLDGFTARTGSRLGRVHGSDGFTARTGPRPGRVHGPDRFTARTGPPPGQVPGLDRQRFRLVDRLRELTDRLPDRATTSMIRKDEPT